MAGDMGLRALSDMAVAGESFDAKEGLALCAEAQAEVDGAASGGSCSAVLA
jgi:hypothetical protein